MKKYYLMILFIAFHSDFSFAQDLMNYFYSSQVEATGNVTSYGLNIFTEMIAIDSNDNIYFGGTFQDSISLDVGLKCTNELDGFICKKDINDNFIWRLHLKCSERVAFNSIYDTNTNLIYLFGGFYGTLYFPNDTITSMGDGDIFIAALNTNGEFENIYQFGSINSERASSLTFTNSGDLVFGGYYILNTSIGPYSFNSPPENLKDIYVAKLNSTGLIEWVIVGKGENNDNVLRCITDNNFNTYVCGYAFDGIVFDTIELMEENQFLYILKISKNGNVLWAKQYGGIYDYPEVLVTDLISLNDDNFTLCGSFRDNLLVETDTFYSNGDYDLYLLNFDSLGNYNWKKTFGGVGEDMSSRLLKKSTEEFYYTGMFVENFAFENISLNKTGFVDMFVSGFTIYGNASWAFTIGGSQTNASKVLSSSIWAHGDNLYLGGMFETDIILGNNQYFSDVNFDAFITGINGIETKTFVYPDLIQFSIYPNPTSSNITVDLDKNHKSPVQINIFDLHGEILKSQVFYQQNNIALDLSDLNNGIYLLKLTYDQQTYCKRLIKI